jgi:hypothetical protein
MLTVGYEAWEYMDWICYACSIRVSELQFEAKRDPIIATKLTTLTSISPERSVIGEDKTDLSYISAGGSGRIQETTRTSFSKATKPSKTPKSVRFVTLGHDEHFYECTPPVAVDLMSSFEKWKDSLRRRWKRVGRCIQAAGRRIERPVISVLMRLGY